MTRVKSATKKPAAKAAEPKVAEPDPTPVETTEPKDEATVATPATDATPEAKEAETAESADDDVEALKARIAELEAEKTAAAQPVVPAGEVIQPEAPFGAAPGDLDPGESAPAVKEVVVVPGNAPEAAPEGTGAVTFLGLKGDVVHPQAVSIVVPDEPTKADYAGIISEGTSYTLRLNQRTRVRPEHVKWLEGHPVFDIERA